MEWGSKTKAGGAKRRPEEKKELGNVKAKNNLTRRSQYGAEQPRMTTPSGCSKTRGVGKKKGRIKRQWDQN